MPLNLQAKLLRVIQDGKVRRLGDNIDKKVDVRIITAMNVDPHRAIENNRIREDLFYRLNVVNIRLLPLRERKEDIMLYVKHFIDNYNQILNKKISGISKEVGELFLEYHWPGNVRELKHVIESSMNFATKEEIKLMHLPVYLSDNINIKKKDNDETSHINYNAEYSTSLDDIIEKIEKELIIKALKKSGGNISKAANILKITRQRLHYKLDKYNIKFS